ncbi:MAG TPA: hypothetical protein VN670_09550 [Acidobacteriaceae bacterium]|nr:hypothetical protein [Acidobacteriaceae bacterium]
MLEAATTILLAKRRNQAADHLISRIVELTKSSDRANLANGNEPNPKSLPESDIADMEFFLDQIQLILPVVGFDFLRGKPLAELKAAVSLPQVYLQYLWSYF